MTWWVLHVGLIELGMYAPSLDIPYLELLLKGVNQVGRKSLVGFPVSMQQSAGTNAKPLQISYNADEILFLMVWLFFETGVHAHAHCLSVT